LPDSNSAPDNGGLLTLSEYLAKLTVFEEPAEIAHLPRSWSGIRGDEPLKVPLIKTGTTRGSS
jgi:hypothetical protein